MRGCHPSTQGIDLDFFLFIFFGFSSLGSCQFLFPFSDPFLSWAVNAKLKHWTKFDGLSFVLSGVAKTQLNVGSYICADMGWSRLLKIIGLFCKRTLWKRLYSAKGTYNFKEPTNRSHLISWFDLTSRYKLQHVNSPQGGSEWEGDKYFQECKLSEEL